MNHSFPKSRRVRSRREYRFIQRNGTTKAGDFLIVSYSPTKNAFSRLGITVSKKFGKAHERNRFKRLVREAFRLFFDHLPIGFDFNIRPRHSQQKIELHAVVQELLKLTVALH